MTGLINLVVDPFGIFRMPLWEGVNAEKSQFQKYVRMIKAHTVRVIKPQGIILGTSRSEYLDPEHPGWSMASRPTYNLGLQSARIYEVLRYLQHANSQRPLRQVVLALDIFMFDPRVRSERGFDEARLDSSHNPDINAAWINDLVMSLLSYDALVESILTVRNQYPLPAVAYLPNGARHPTRIQSEIELLGGHRKLFLDQISPGSRRPPGRQADEPYDAFRAVLIFCRAKGIDLRILINPEHARLWESSWQNGTWGKYEDWKRHLVRILNEEATQFPWAEPFPLWDFSGYNSITTEQLPPLGDVKTTMRWYWEGSHYKPATGDLMLDRVFGLKTARIADHADFGDLLTSGNIEERLNLTRRLRQAYADAHPLDVEEIRQKIQELRNLRSGSVGIL
jgi:hypothetical protein